MKKGKKLLLPLTRRIFLVTFIATTDLLEVHTVTSRTEELTTHLKIHMPQGTSAVL